MEIFNETCFRKEDGLRQWDGSPEINNNVKKS